MKLSDDDLKAFEEVVDEIIIKTEAKPKTLEEQKKIMKDIETALKAKIPSLTPEATNKAMLGLKKKHDIAWHMLRKQ